MKTLILSGGSTKIAFIAGAASELDKNVNYDYYIGTSAGAISTLFISLGLYDDLQKIILNIDTENFFDCPPINDNDKLQLNSILNICLGKKSLAKFTLGELIQKYYAPHQWDSFLSSGKKIWVGVTNLQTMQVEYILLNDFDYYTMIKWVVASSSIPLACEPVKIGDFEYLDGGICEHFGGSHAISLKSTRIDLVLSRPEAFETSKESDSWKTKGVPGTAIRVLSIMSKNLSYLNEDILKSECLISNTPLGIVYPSQTLTHNIYRMDSDLSRIWWNQGVQKSKILLENGSSNTY